MPDIFLSYSREDQATARRYAEALQREGFEVWWDQALHPGEDFDEVTEKALEDSKAVVVLWSKTSVTSRWVRAEATQANAANKLVPVMVEDCKRPIMFELKHTADLAGWKGSSDDPVWQAFAASLRRFTGKSVSDRPANFPAFPSSAVAGSGLRTRIAAIGIAVLLLAGGVWWAMGRPGLASAPRVASVADPVRIAVMPFQNLSADDDQAYLSNGLAEDVSLQLNLIDAMRANGPEQTERFRTSDLDLRAIAAKLGVEYLVTGTYRKEQAQWRITVKLIDGRDGAPKGLAKSYEGSVDDLFSLQRQMVEDVALAVGVALGVSDPSALGGTENVEAHMQWLRARESWRRGGSFLDQLAFLRKAVEFDPQFMRARLSLSMTLRNVIRDAPTQEVEELRRQRREAAAKLEDMPPDGLQALRYRSYILSEQFDWRGAVDAAEAAFAAAPPNDFDTSYALATALLQVGRISQGITFARRCVEIEPRHQDPSGMLQRALRAAGRDAEADREADRARAEGLQFAFLDKWGDPSALRETISRATDQNGKLQIPFEGEEPELLQDLPAARVVLRGKYAALSTGEKGRYGDVFARPAGALADSELAVAAKLQRIRERPESTQASLIDAWLHPSFPRSSPEFKNLVRELKMDGYWRESGKWSEFCQPVGDDDFECFDKPIAKVN